MKESVEEERQTGRRRLPRIVGVEGFYPRNCAVKMRRTCEEYILVEESRRVRERRGKEGERGEGGSAGTQGGPSSVLARKNSNGKKKRQQKSCAREKPSIQQHPYHQDKEIGSSWGAALPCQHASTQEMKACMGGSRNWQKVGLSSIL